MIGCEAMSFITGMDRSQTLLLPESLDDYVSAQHPVRFLDAFVEGLDLKGCGFRRTEAAETGRPPFAPGDLLKLYLWGYLNKVRSSRRLELECACNLELLWLMRKLQPAFKTLADFRKDNAGAFKKVFRQFHLLCRDLGLFGAEVVAIDGTKLKAVNNVARNFTPGKLRASLERIDARLVEFLAALDAGDSAEPPPTAAGAGQLEGEDRRLVRAPAALSGGARGHGGKRRDAGLAHRPGQPPDAQGGRGLQRADRSRCNAQAHRRSRSGQRTHRPRATKRLLKYWDGPCCCAISRRL